jgi:hypothetical protein
MTNIVVELEFPWDESGTSEDEQTFAEMCLKLISDGAMGPLSPKGGVIASVRTVRGSMAVARQVTG